MAAAKGLLNLDLTWEQFARISGGFTTPKNQHFERLALLPVICGDSFGKCSPVTLLLSPTEQVFFVAEITGAATYDVSKVDDDSAYRRPVRWLNDKKPIPRQLAGQLSFHA